jgi:hypothetical protein
LRRNGRGQAARALDDGGDEQARQAAAALAIQRHARGNAARYHATRYRRYDSGRGISAEWLARSGQRFCYHC